MCLPGSFANYSDSADSVSGESLTTRNCPFTKSARIEDGLNYFCGMKKNQEKLYISRYYPFSLQDGHSVETMQGRCGIWSRRLFIKSCHLVVAERRHGRACRSRDFALVHTGQGIICRDPQTFLEGGGTRGI